MIQEKLLQNERGNKMTKQEKLARRLILNEIMSSQDVSKQKALSIVEELENFGLIRFGAAGTFAIKA